MHTSIYAGADSTTTDEFVDRVRAARAEGWTSTWVSQGTGLDAVTAAAVALAAADHIHVGTAVVPIQGRHPLPLVQQALTISSAFGAERFSLGVGVTHPMVSEQWFGVPYRHVVGLCAEQLSAMSALMSQERRVDLAGDHLVAHVQISIEAPAPALVLAALGPTMLGLAARFANGVVTWMTGAIAIRDEIIPTLSAASESFDRPPPRIIAGLPISVTASIDQVRNSLAESMKRTGALPSYRRMLAAAGVQEAVDIAIIGSREHVMARLGELAALGVDEVLVNAVGDADEVAATRELLAHATW